MNKSLTSWRDALKLLGATPFRSAAFAQQRGPGPALTWKGW